MPYNTQMIQKSDTTDRKQMPHQPGSETLLAPTRSGMAMSDKQAKGSGCSNDSEFTFPRCLYTDHSQKRSTSCETRERVVEKPPNPVVERRRVAYACYW
ncbi:hypothetical protein DPEC_G00114140 [Dallia pectoralis]|uniref:Uncharacterized protein n=1 Tax=Dallia pectoralis TaxID=75939 RepID=A0ACC2GTL4_DALPE|nr:hypothetical protein DPEC_G00114140 [Dallia pectoralis]